MRSTPASEKERVIPRHPEQAPPDAARPGSVATLPTTTSERRPERVRLVLWYDVALDAATGYVTGYGPHDCLHEGPDRSAHAPGLLSLVNSLVDDMCSIGDLELFPDQF